MTATTPPLTAARIEQIKARLEKATPGKWTGKENDWNEVHIRAPSRKHKTEIAAVSVGYNEPMEGEQRANINLICNAPADIAALLADIERLRDRIDNANQAASETHRNWQSRCYAIMAALGEDYGDALEDSSHGG